MEHQDSDSSHPYSVIATENDAQSTDAQDDPDIMPLLDKAVKNPQTPPAAAGVKSNGISHAVLSRSTQNSPAHAASALNNVDSDPTSLDAVHTLNEKVLRFCTEIATEQNLSEEDSAYRNRVSVELEDLTASLFEEANNMVRDEKIKRHHAEQLLAEISMKFEALQAEATWRRSQMAGSTGKQPFKRSISIHETGTLPQSPSTVDSTSKSPLGIMQWIRSFSDKDTSDLSTIPLHDSGDATSGRYKETDPIVHREFVQWRSKPSLDRDLPLINRIYRQEIEPNFDFINKELATKVLKAVEDNTIVIEEGDKLKPFARECSLSVAPRVCQYRMKLTDDIWHPISAFARNRIITVCDFVTYVRYIRDGLVVRGVHDTWWEIVRLRERMCQARLGIL